MANATHDDCERDARDLVRAVIRQQRDWAIRRGVALDDADCTSDLAENLFSSLSEFTRAELNASLPALLGDGEKAGELSALNSTAALVHNVFDYWRGRAGAPIVHACGAGPSEAALELHFAAGAPSQPCGARSFGPASVVLETASRPIVVVASFLEPYARVDNNPGAALLDAEGGWSGLQACRNLALDLRSNARRFRHLAVASLLALGQSWTRDSGQRGFRLLYLWYDGGGPAARRVRTEIDRFRMRAGGELHFAARSWQEIFRDIRNALGPDSGDDGHATYLQYLGSRYFPLDPSA